jgi:O-antigen/teichoic acid export membrane protein
VATGVLSNLYSQAVTILTQLALLPIFLSRWNSDKYGQWVVISTIPQYLIVADAGVLTAATNLMTMHEARGERADVLDVFRSCLLIIAMLVPAVAVIVGVALVFVDFGLDRDQAGAVFAITLCALFAIACGLFDAAYRPFGKYSRVTILLATARLVELIGMTGGIFIGGSLTSVALGFLCGRSLASVVLFVLARRDVPEISWSLRGPNWGLVRRLVRTGSGFVYLTFGSILMLQGMVILVGFQLGAVAVAFFTSSRTISRLLAQIAVLTGRSLAPEVSALYGANKHADIDRLSRRMTWLVMSLTIAGALLLAVLGREILAFWSHGKLKFDGPVFYLLLGTAITTAYWQIRSVRLTATNRHQFLAVIFFVAALAGLLCAYVGMPRFGLTAASGGALLTEAAMVWGTAYVLHKLGSPRRDAEESFSEPL